LHISSSSGSSTPLSYSSGTSTRPSYSSGTSTRPSYSSGSSRSVQNLGKAECSNCKFLAEKIKTLEAKIKILEGALEMEMHPEKHTLESAAIFHELYNDMGKLEREFLPSSVHNIYSFYELEAFEIEPEEIGEIDSDTLTMEQYMALTRGDDKKKLLAGSINTWDFLEKAFIQKYRPPSKTTKELEEIHNFKQEIDDTLYRAWERYNDLIFICPQHELRFSTKDGAYALANSDSSDGIVAITNKLDCLLVVTCKSCHNLSRFGS
ncbi:hypothetical protein Tco_1128458, partial [Tanacetum coccineum]